MRDDDVEDREVPEEELEAAEGASPPHHHGPSEDGSLAEHLRDLHGIHVPADLSDTTLEGVHDRVHRERHASEH